MTAPLHELSALQVTVQSAPSGHVTCWFKHLPSVSHTVLLQPVLAAVPVALSVPELVGQAEHAAEPVAALNESAAHAVKGPPSGPVYPAPATQPDTVRRGFGGSQEAETEFHLQAPLQ